MDLFHQNITMIMKSLQIQKNRLSFKIKHNIKKEFITLQLDDILTPKKIETDDSKITIFSILLVEKAKEMQMQIIDELKIEGFQFFNSI